MTDAEDNEKLILSVDLNYGQLAQDVKHAIHFLQRLSDKLDQAAINKKFMDKERRNGDRRNGSE